MKLLRSAEALDEYMRTRPPYLEYLMDSLVQIGLILLLVCAAAVFLLHLYPFTQPREFYPDGNIPQEERRKERKIIKRICIILAVLWIILSVIYSYGEYTNIPHF